MTLAGRLPTTRWSLVLRAGNPDCDPTLIRQSLDELCQQYWPALYGYLRHRGHPQSDAEDLTQGFFADLLARDAITAADASRGRFRAFLYSSLDNFVAKQVRHSNTQKRGGDASTFSLDQSRYQTDNDSWIGPSLADPQSLEPAELFDRQWAKCLIRQTLDELRDEYIELGKTEWFDQLSVFLSATDVSADKRASIGRQLQLSATALKVAIHRLRSRYRQRMVDAVAQTVDDPGLVGDERQILFSALGKKS